MVFNYLSQELMSLRSLRCPQLTGLRYLSALILMAFTLIQLTTAQTIPTTSVEINEMDVYSGMQQQDKSFSFFYLTVSPRYFTGVENLAFKLIAEGYNSDPDIFISKTNMQPNSSSTSSWFCMKDGSETCTIPSSMINTNDTFYFGIRCINQCSYQLRAYYTTISALSEATRTQLRLDGLTTNIFQYYIPQDAATGQVTGISITVEVEDDYMPLDIYLSLSQDLYQIEEKKSAEIITRGKTFKFTTDDYTWCTRCFVYLVLDTMIDGRYYITATAIAVSSSISNGQSADRVINSRSTECYSYSLSSAGIDALITVNQYQGDGEIFISTTNSPSGITDSSVKFVSQRAPQRAIVAATSDLSYWNINQGLFYVCAYAYEDLSFSLLLQENTYNRLFDIRDNQLYTFNVYSSNYQVFRFSTKDFTSNSTISLTLQSYNLKAGQVPPYIFYKVCSSGSQSSCTLDDASAKGSTATMKAASGVVSNITRSATIQHVPSACVNPSSCYYLFSVYYNGTNTPQSSSLLITHNTTISQTVVVGSTYTNILNMGSYSYYNFVPNSVDGYNYLDSLVISLYTSVGDADLFVSTGYTNSCPSNKTMLPSINCYTWQSRKMQSYDQIILNTTENFTIGSKTIYIAVYGQTFSEYELSFEATYQDEYNAQLIDAVPLEEGVAKYNYMTNEQASSFYSYTPFWSAVENRTMVFYAQVIFNKVYFYMDINTYPSWYNSDDVGGWQDWQDIIAITPQDPRYSTTGSYYIRAQPNYSLYDLISQRQYIFNFYAFSQPQNTSWIDLQLNENITGYANQTTMFYRHYNIKYDATYVYTVYPIIGNPTLMIAINDNTTRVNASNPSSYNHISQNTGLAKEQIVLTFDARLKDDVNCDFSGYPLNGGNTLCRTWIGVQCSGTSACIYNISVAIQGSENVTTIPRFLIADEFYTGKIPAINQKASTGAIQYFYYPVHQNNTGETAIFLNKTGPLGQNGDSILVVSLQNDSTQPFQNWNYPTRSSYLTASFSNDTTKPEIIELCSRLLSDKCQNNSCVLIIGVIAASANKTSHYRLKIFQQPNKLYSGTPVQGTIATKGKYQYYWFPNNATVGTTSSKAGYWEYNIASSVLSSGQDVDLFVTAIDGRKPIDIDFDYSSTNVGADSIVLSSNDTFYSDRGYDLSVGAIIIVGVKALADNVTFQLMMTGPSRYNISSFFELKNGVATSNVTFLNAASRGINNTHYYKFSNWGYKDFKLQVDVTSGGPIFVYFNYFSETQFTDNGILAVPVSPVNSLWTVQVPSGQSQILRVYKEQLGGNFCYYCYYYVTVVVNSTSQTQYRVSQSQLSDSGDNVKQLTVNSPTTFTLPSTGSVTQYKFLLDSKDPFIISVTLSTGYAIVYVGLYPDQPLTYAWTVQGGIGAMSIKVRTTDQNFYIGAYYYVTVQSTSGSSTVSLQVNQIRTIGYLSSGVTMKDQYWTMEEQVKFYYFQAPAPTSSTVPANFAVTINITSLSDQSNINYYPTVLLTKNSYASQVSDMRTLTYPNMLQNDLKFGDNFSYLMNHGNASYSFIGNSTLKYTYYTVALYSWSYGFSDRRKAEFKISLTIKNGVTKLQSSNQQDDILPIGQDIQIKNDDLTFGDSLIQKLSDSYANYVQQPFDNLIKLFGY